MKKCIYLILILICGNFLSAAEIKKSVTQGISKKAKQRAKEAIKTWQSGNTENGLNLLTISAIRDNVPQTKVFLAHILINSERGVEKKVSLGVKLLKEAIDQEIDPKSKITAKYILAMTYFSDSDFYKPEEAIKLLNEVANQNTIQATKDLAIKYLKKFKDALAAAAKKQE